MVTNGQIFNKDIVDAFKRFNEYRNQLDKYEIIKEYGEEFYKKNMLQKNEVMLESHSQLINIIIQYQKR